jgi:hypothetical protein
MESLFVASLPVGDRPRAVGDGVRADHRGLTLSSCQSHVCVSRSIHGILFDFDSDVVRPDSKPQLDDIAKLLKESPGLKVLGVGRRSPPRRCAGVLTRHDTAFYSPESQVHSK